MIVNLTKYWRRLGTDPTDAPAHNAGKYAIPAWLQAGIDDGWLRSTRSTPGYEGRRRADARGCRCDPNMVGHNWRCPAWRVGGAS